MHGPPQCLLARLLLVYAWWHRQRTRSVLLALASSQGLNGCMPSHILSYLAALNCEYGRLNDEFGCFNFTEVNSRAKPDQARIAGPGSGFKNSKPEPDEAKPKPRFPGQAKPAKHYAARGPCAPPPLVWHLLLPLADSGGWSGDVVLPRGGRGPSRRWSVRGRQWR
ncbi:hypothetical protein DFH09DRAFT_1101398 [Mycena vulgaris]|nr:hypothetical protein DFH09DRAFT_1101398 [Mycena vulgaris]